MLKFNIFWLYRIKVKQATSFLKGLLSKSHLKCKQPRFEEGMQEAKMQVSFFFHLHSTFLIFQYFVH